MALLCVCFEGPGLKFSIIVLLLIVLNLINDLFLNPRIGRLDRHRRPDSGDRGLSAGVPRLAEEEERRDERRGLEPGPRGSGKPDRGKFDRAVVDVIRQKLIRDRRETSSS